MIQIQSCLRINGWNGVIEMYKRILLAIDGSEHSMRAANEALKMAALNSESKIEIVYVADFEKAKTEVLHAQGKEELDYTRKSRLQPVEELLKMKGVPYDVKILRGEPGPTIVEYANKHQTDIVILGSRGLNVLQEFVLGSVSHKVAKRAQCPVLIVK